MRRPGSATGGADFVTLPDVGRISREQLHQFSPAMSVELRSETLGVPRRGPVRTASSLRASNSAANLGATNIGFLTSGRRWPSSTALGGNSPQSRGVSGTVSFEASTDAASLVVRGIRGVSIPEQLRLHESHARDAVRLPPPPSFTLTTAPVSRPSSGARNISAAGREVVSTSSSPIGLGIRRVAPRGAAVAAVRHQRELHNSEVQLPDVGRMSRSELRRFEAAVAEEELDEQQQQQLQQQRNRQRQQLQEWQQEQQEQHLQQRIRAQQLLHDQLQLQLQQEQQLHELLEQHLQLENEDVVSSEGAEEVIDEVVEESQGSPSNASTTRSSLLSRQRLASLEEEGDLNATLASATAAAAEASRRVADEAVRAAEVAEAAALAATAAATAAAAATASFALARTHAVDSYVEVPGVGRMRRRQLRNLQAVLDGSDFVPAGGDDLPDLSNFTAAQLQQLEAAISSGALEQLSETEPAETASQTLPRPEQETSDAPPTGDPAILLNEAPASAGSITSATRMSRTAGAWRVHEVALVALTAKGPFDKGLECSICCEPLVSEGCGTNEVIAFPCHGHGCGSLFHTDCIRPWLERNPSCPLCRDDQRDLVRPATPQISATTAIDGGNPLLDLWFIAMALQREERRRIVSSGLGLSEGRPLAGSQLADLQGVVLTASALVDVISTRLGQNGADDDEEEAAFLHALAIAAGLERSRRAMRQSTPLPPSSHVHGPPLVDAPMLRTVAGRTAGNERSQTSIARGPSDARAASTLPTII